MSGAGPTDPVHADGSPHAALRRRRALYAVTTLVVVLLTGAAVL